MLKMHVSVMIYCQYPACCSSRLRKSWGATIFVGDEGNFYSSFLSVANVVVAMIVLSADGQKRTSGL